MRIWIQIAWIFALSIAEVACCAQEISLPKVEGPIEISGPWAITAGDNGLSVNAAAESSHWHPTGVYSPADHPAQPEVLWYRAEMRMDQPPHAPALLISPAALGCTIFVNGEKAANCAQLSAPNVAAHRGLLVHLPATAGVRIDVAIRLYRPLYVKPGGLKLVADELLTGSHDGGRALGIGTGDVLFGSVRSLEDHRAALDAMHFYDLLPQALLCFAELIGGVLLLVVFVDDRGRKEYAWFAVFLWLDGTASLLSVFQRMYPLMSPSQHYASNAIGLIARYAPLVGFLGAFTGVRAKGWVRIYQWMLVALTVVTVLGNKGVELGWWSGSERYTALLYELLVQLPFVVGSLFFLGIQWRRGNKEAGLLAPSFLLANGMEMLGLLVPYFGRRFHWGPFGFDFDDLSMFFFLVSLAPVMLLRYRRDSLEHARATAELDAARGIQQQLVPAHLPFVEGYALDAAYVPAAEVSGDLYQVFEQSDGSALIVVGDVSGKGLKAAMKGTLLLGAVQVLASQELSPAALLARLNREIAVMADGGFITFVCARVDRDGRVTIANAGHLPPYLNGQEVELNCGLPLGVFAETEYEETVVRLEPGERLTFLSDGVVEARGMDGELFGFERTRRISCSSAKRIAEAAQKFGQDDDITVLTLAFAPAVVRV